MGREKGTGPCFRPTVHTSVVGINRFLQRGVLLRLATVLFLVLMAVGLSWWMMPQVEYLPAGNGSGDQQQIVPGNRAFPLPSLDLNCPELRVLRKSEQGADLGISTDELGYTIDALIDGAYATDYYLDNNKIDLTIVGSEKFANRTQDLSQLSMATSSGNLVRLDALAEVVYAGGPEQINRPATFGVG